LAYTGCRIGEAAGLFWQDVDTTTGIMIVRRSWDAPTTKSGEPRRVPLAASLRRMLAVWQGECPVTSEGLCFPDPRTGRLRYHGKAMSRWFRRWKNVPKPPPRDPLPKPGHEAEWDAACRAEREHHEASRPPRDAVTVEMLEPEIVRAAFENGPKWAASIVAGRIFDRTPRTCRDAVRVPWPEDPLRDAILRLAFGGQLLSADDT
jgi:hypothetical protein